MKSISKKDMKACIARHVTGEIDQLEMICEGLYCKACNR